MSGQLPRIANELIWRETDDGIVIVDPEKGKVRVLNGVGSVIWKLVSEQLHMNSIAQKIAAQYNIPEGQALTDAQAFLAELATKNLVIWAD